MSNVKDFEIVDGVLNRYTGNDADVVIPDNVTSIGVYAFAKVFGSSLKSITIPDSVTSIREYAFSGCSSLESVTIPDSVTSIGNDAFSKCSSLKSITIPDSVTSIGLSAFSKCSGLKSVKISGSVTSIGLGAFEYCSGLKSVTIPDSVTSIGESAFGGCSSLKSVTIPDTVTSIGKSAFGGCDKLKSVAIPDSVTSIGDGAFGSCNNLTSITIPDSVTSIGSDAFIGCNSLKSVTIPDSVTSIKGGVFLYCSSLTSITIPDSVTSIGKRAFGGCSSLKSVTIPDSVTSIGDGAFEDCKNLKSITIPDSVTRIGNDAFPNIVLIMSHLPKSDFIAKKAVGVILTGNKKKYYAYAKTNLKQTDDDIVCLDGWGDYDLELINNGPKYKFGTMARSLGALGRLLDPVELSDDTKTVYAEFLNKDVKKLFALAEESMMTDMVRDMLSLDVWDDKSLETLKKLISGSIVPEIKALSGIALSTENDAFREDKTSSTDPLKEKYSNKLKEIDGNEVLKNMKLLGVSMPEVLLADGTKAPDEMIRFLLVSYGGQSGEYKTIPDADEAAKLLSYESLCNAMDSVSTRWDGPAYPHVLPMLCRYGNATRIRDLTGAWKSWGEWHVYGAKGRKAQEVLEKAMILSDTREAAVWLADHGGLSDYAKIRGLNVDDIYADCLFDFGFDKDGKQVFDLGSIKIEARLTSELKLELYDEANGKIIKSVPKKDVDPDVQKKISDEVTDISQNLKKAVKLKNKLLFVDYLDGIKVTADAWKRQYLENPLLHKAAKLLVWSQKDKSFMVTDDGLIDCEGKPYSLNYEPVVVAHPQEMKGEEVTAWQKYYTSNGLKQPFAQIWEPVFDKDEIEDDRYKDCQIRTVFLKNQEKRGIYCDWFESSFNKTRKELSIKGFIVKASDVPKQDDGYSYLSIDYLHPNFWNRRTNNVIAFLDRITVLGRIQKDDVSIMSRIDKYTLAQVMEFINVAQEAGAVNVLALLLDYKNQSFSDFDPMEAFTLE